MLFPLALVLAFQSIPKNISAVVNAERKFAALTAEKGIKTGFLANMDEQSILFRPGPVKGVTFTTSQPDSKALLKWAPDYADVAASGELGYTTGPWTIQKEAGGAILGQGRYVTIWRHKKGGWKIVTDCGGPTATPVAQMPTSFTFPNPTGKKYSVTDVPPDFGKRLEKGVYQDPGYSDDQYTFHSWAVGISRSGDLAYTYGKYELLRKEGAEAGADLGYYLRIWKHQPEGWRQVQQVLMPTKA